VNAQSDVELEAIRRHTEKLLASEQLCKSETSRKLLTYLVERSLHNDAPKESEIAFDVFGKGASFSGAENSVVRVGARTLRQKLAEYYAGPGQNDALRLVIPKGGYRLTVAPQSPASVPALDSRTPAPSIAEPPPRPQRHFPRSIAWFLLASLAASLTVNMRCCRWCEW